MSQENRREAMAVAETDPVRARIRAVITVEQFLPTPPRPLLGPDGRQVLYSQEELIADVERKLSVAMPPWLREVYLACNGFLGPFGVCYLYHLDGSEGVGDFTLFLREQEWAPRWLARAIVFGYIGGSGSTTTHTAALDGQLIEWCYGDGEAFRALEGGLFELWRRIQEEWDDLG
jgi:hypothetical protein